MLDTIELRCQGDPAGAHLPFIADLANLSYHHRTLPDGTPVNTWSGEHPLFGRVRCNDLGTVTIAGSLPRLLFATGKRTHEGGILTATEAQHGYDHIQAEICQHIPWADQVTLTRFDIVYDRVVADPGATILAAAAVLTPTRKGKAAYANAHHLPEGLMLRGNQVAHRLYDKRQENPTYPPGTLRSEEQLRRGAASFKAIYDEATGRFNPEAGLVAMRHRYRACTNLQVATPSLKTPPDAVAYLYATSPSLHAQIDGMYQRTQRWKMHHRSRNIMGQTLVDLRPPDNAWA